MAIWGEVKVACPWDQTQYDLAHELDPIQVPSGVLNLFATIDNVY